MTDKEILDAMKVMLQPIKNHSLHLNQKTSERAVRKDIQYLNDEVDTLIAVLEAKGILKKVE